MNSVHRLHDRDQFLKSKRHFIFAFHDSTFECIAHNFDVSIHKESLSDATQRMVALLDKR